MIAAILWGIVAGVAAAWVSDKLASRRHSAEEEVAQRRLLRDLVSLTTRAGWKRPVRAFSGARWHKGGSGPGWFGWGSRDRGD